MSDRKLLNNKELTERFSRLKWESPGSWKIDKNKLSYTHTFADFRQAFCFITNVALISEKFDHHATIENTYNRVSLSLYTHDADGITELDFKWIELLSLC